MIELFYKALGWNRWRVVAGPLALVTASVAVGGATPALTPRPSTQAPHVYRLLSTSRLEIRTGTGGLLGFAGDDHLIRAGSFEGEAVFSAARPGDARVELRVPVAELRVLTPVDPDDRRDIRRKMLDEVLRADSFPEVTFRSTSVNAPADSSLRVAGELTVRGRTRPVTVDLGLYVSPAADTLRVVGSFDARLSDFGIEPPTAGLGTVKVKDEVTFVVDAGLIRATTPDPAPGPDGGATPTRTRPR